ncbi:NK1R protein, partial [Erythrocercus mccallii]|nr:NK1R protein [Erythrocercus mccallii]
RYTPPIHPLRPRLSAAATKALLGPPWLLAMLLAFPQGYFSVTAPPPGRVVCLVEWPEPGGAVSAPPYPPPMTVLLYLLPLLVIGCAYAPPGRTLWASAIPGDSCGRYHPPVSAKRKVVKMMIIVVCTFALCWLPYHVYFTLQYLRPEWYLRPAAQQLYLAVMWLAMSSTMYNPIIYCCLNDRFRLGFKHAFRWCPCVSAGAYEGLELRSARFLRTHSSVSKLSRMDTATVASALGAAEEEPDEPGGAERLSLDVASNGSSRSDSKTVSESLSFHSNSL